MKFPTGDVPASVFLTDQGGIELCWEDGHGDAVQVEFTEVGAEYYKAATDDEGSIAFNDLGSLALLLSV